jgi:6-phosphofructokinase 1
MVRNIERIGIFTSGGDAPGMNACIRAVVRTALNSGLETYGIYRGYNGLIGNEIKPILSSDVSNIIQRGGTILKTARSQAFFTPEGRQKAYLNLKEHSIDALVAIGGDGTFTGARVFMEEYPDIHIIGCPGTIDNDLSGTDFTIGFDTAINTVVDAVDKIRDTAASHDRLFFVEVMGRDSGLIALDSGISTGAEAILIPETETSVELLIQQLERGWLHHKTSCIIIVAEGDEWGGANGIAKEVASRLSHYECKVSILGHIQRGGKPTASDRLLASRLGYEAVEALLRGKNGAMAGIVNGNIMLTPFEQAIKDEGKLNMSLLKMAEILSL